MPVPLPRPLLPQGLFGIGDALYTGGKQVRFGAIPAFSPEVFARVSNASPAKFKSYRKGLAQVRRSCHAFHARLLCICCSPFHLLPPPCRSSPCSHFLQLLEEGAVNLLRDRADASSQQNIPLPPVLAAVGQLQLDVVQYRLLHE